MAVELNGVAFKNDGTNNNTAVRRYIGANDIAVNEQRCWQDGTQF